MKNLKYMLITSMVILTLISVPSCKKSFYTDANLNPNAPLSVTPSALLSTVEGSLAYTYGGTFALFASLFDQQTQGVSRQAAAYYQYIVTSQDLDDPWSRWYTNDMTTCKDLITQADAKGYNEYSGIARLLMAYSLQATVDVWGDIPYSQAFRGADQLQPGYDRAASLYSSINGLVNDGIAKLNADPGAITPGGEDRIYGGDAAKWIKFGHAILARLAIHQSKGNVGMANTALSEIALSFADNTDNAEFPFGGSETTGNPWYQFNQERGDCSFSGSTLASILTSLNDPRYGIYIDSANDGAGFGLGAYYGSINSPIELITYDELQFMKAEATLRATGDFTAAQTAYQAGITANMEKLGVASGDITTYLAAQGTLPVTTVDDAIQAVSVQEYLALYLNPEAWTLWRRTGSPALAPVSGSQGIPRRFRYVQTEYFYNAANTPSATLWSPKLFWDN